MPFYFHFYNRGYWVAMAISGDFRSGVMLSHFYPFIQALANMSKGKMSIDLKGVTFMDSDSMELVDNLSDRCEIEWNIKSIPYQRFLDWKAR